MDSLTNGNLGFVPQVVLSSFLPCACVLLCPAGVWAERCVLLLAGRERLPCRVSGVTVRCVAQLPHLPGIESACLVSEWTSLVSCLKNPFFTEAEDN